MEIMKEIKIYFMRNGMAMVFDENGKQIPELQGRIEKLPELLKKFLETKKWTY